VRDLCDAARVNVAAVNYHFGDKLGLYQEILQGAIDAMQGTTDAARRAGEGLPAEERLRRYIAVFVGRLLAAGSGQVHRLIHREMNDPTPFLDRLIEEGVRPRLDYLTPLVAEIAGLSPRDERAVRAVFSVQAQCVSCFPNAIGARLGFAPGPADAETIAAHIAEFSLAGIRALGRRPSRSAAPPSDRGARRGGPQAMRPGPPPRSGRGPGRRSSTRRTVGPRRAG
jgi:TetR/AcrR family transcriptional regulator, regulator of cefoperazone and chloramphenicol sensitivity